MKAKWKFENWKQTKTHQMQLQLFIFLYAQIKTIILFAVDFYAW